MRAASTRSSCARRRRRFGARRRWPQAAGRTELAANLVRAAELATVPDEVLLEVYTALRPHRSTAAELEAWADRLESEYGAASTAAFVREALAAYESAAS